MSRHLTKLVLLVAVCTLAFPALSYGQEARDFEVFGGFSAYHPGVEGADFLGSFWMYGAMGEVTWYATDWFGITAALPLP